MQIACESCRNVFDYDPAISHEPGFAFCTYCHHKNALPEPPTAYLTMRLEDGTVQQYPLGPVNSIGRHPNNTIQIMDRMISKHHARIVFQNNQYELEDLKSRNGTFVNNQRVSDSPLASGDDVQLGTVQFKYFEDEPEQPRIDNPGDTYIESSLPRMPDMPTRPNNPPFGQAAESEPPAQESSPPEKTWKQQVTIIGGEDLSAQIAQLRHDMQDRDFLPGKEIHDVDTLRKNYEKLRIAHELNRQIGLELDQDLLFDRILEETFKLVSADRGVILMKDADGNWSPRCLKVKSPHHTREINISRTILQAVEEQRSALLTSDAKIDERFSKSESIIMQGIRSSMSIPLISRSNEQILGIIHLDTQNAIGVFTEKDLQIMSVVAQQAADALDNARLAKKIEEETVIRAHLQRFLSPAVMTRLTADDLTIRMGGEMVETTIMFTDIRGFTSLSEGYYPQKLIQELNLYFELLVDEIFEREGTLDKFIGDAIMAVWGTPESHPQDPLRAVQAAVEIQARLVAFNEQREADGLKPFFTGIGINTGEVVAGNMGSTKRLEFTVIGDGVNLAARLCSEAKKNEVIISESTYQRVKDHFTFTQLPPAKVKGKKEPVTIYRVDGKHAASPQAATDSPEHQLSASKPV